MKDDRNQTLAVDQALLHASIKSRFGGIVRDFVADELQQEIIKSLKHRSHKPRATDDFQ